MDPARLQKLLLLIGIIVTVLAIAGWALVNYFLVQQPGGSLTDSLSCIYSFSARCNLSRGMVWLRGISVYEPMLFWMGLVILAIAVALKRSLAIKDAAA